MNGSLKGNFGVGTKNIEAGTKASGKRKACSLKRGYSSEFVRFAAISCLARDQLIVRGINIQLLERTGYVQTTDASGILNERKAI